MLALLLPLRPVRADSDLVARSRAHYEKGRSLYEGGRFREAIAEFRAGFELVPRPLFLINLGQAYRLLGDLRAARVSYQKFLDAAPGNDPDRASVVEICAELDQQIARLLPEPDPPQVAPPEARPPPTAGVASPPPRRSFIRRHWWIIPTASVVALTGLGLGLYFGLRTDDRCEAYSFGCTSVVAPSR